MRLLLDTHVLIWSVSEHERLSARVNELLSDDRNTPVFSVVALWEIAIKFALGKPDFDIDPKVMRPALLAHGYEELTVTGPHVVAVANLPSIHRDPFDRLLIAQSQVEGIALLTADRTIAEYPGPIEFSI